MTTAPTISLTVSMNDRLLQQNILQMSRATGRTVKEETRTVFKGMLRQVIDESPPGGPRLRGQAAKRAGEGAISRDLHRMGFVPVDIKGFRMQTHAFGRPITPVRVPVKENPKFADPEGHHRARLRSKHAGQVTRGGKQAFYARRSQITSLKNKLFRQVGMMASGWVTAALQLGVTVPAWIKRHAGSGRGSGAVIVETPDKITMRVVNHFPAGATAQAASMRGRIEVIKKAAIGRLKRQLPHILKRNVRAAKR